MDKVKITKEEQADIDFSNMRHAQNNMRWNKFILPVKLCKAMYKVITKNKKIIKDQQKEIERLNYTIQRKEFWIQKKNEEKHDELFKNYYDQMGFKIHPFCIGMDEDNKGNKIYLFKSNYNKMSLFENAIDSFEAILNLQISSIHKNNQDMSIVEVVCRKKYVAPERLNIFNVLNSEIEDYDSIPLDSNRSWNFRLAPHALICGTTGGGKTSMLFYFIRQILARGAELYIIDPKRSALSYLENFIGNRCVCETDDILNMVKTVIEVMNQRFEDMKKHHDYRPMTDYSDYNMKPVFLVFDEVMSFFAATDKTSTEIRNILLQIIAKGREAGVFAMLITQRADTKYINGATRDLLGLRMSLGSLSGDGYKMCFGSTNYNLRDTSKGAGFLQIDGDGIGYAREYQSPWMKFTEEQIKTHNLKSEYDFFEDFKKLLDDNSFVAVENENKTMSLDELRKLKIDKKLPAKIKQK
jgi:hypothetical protein